ncbi:MAG: DUF885 family protein [Lactimicrobium sp.]|uniref:DUF885 family protein n=1 Tax=Lactimicrobium sp. TaxID=2563780 RepID=UPI002F351358
MTDRLKKVICMMSAALLCVPAVFVPVKAEETAQGNSDFDALLQQDFINTMEDDYLTMHFTLKDPESMGIVKPEVTVGKDPHTEITKAKSEAEDMLAKLKAFDYDSLSTTQQHDYDALVYAYTDQLNRSDENYDWLFTPGNNLITNLSTNLTEFIFYTREDFDDYVTLLQSVQSYLAACLSFTEEQAEAGYFMSDKALEETESQIASFVAKTQDNPIIVDFNDDADASQLLTDGERVDLKTQVSDIVINQIIPSCQMIADKLNGYKGKGGQTGYYDMDGGLDYYTLDEQNTASTSKPLDDQFDELDSFIQDTVSQLASLGSNAGNGTVNFTDANKILSYLSSEETNYGFPAIPDVTYTADSLDPSVVSGNVLAYYVSAPVDDYSNNVIKINDSNISDLNELYGTLAHEGYPGHLYQHVYYLATNPNLIREACSFLGYTEGWAMYAEVHAYSWNVLSDSDATYQQVTTELNYALCALADIGVNGMGWSQDDLSDYLSSVGLNTQAASSLYEQCLIYPTDYNSYGYGLVRLVTLENEAREALGDDFELEEFNKVILDNGPRTLDSVEDDVTAWVEANGGTMKSDSKTSKSASSSFSPVYGVAIAAGAALIIVFVVLKKKHNGKGLAE